MKISTNLLLVCLSLLPAHAVQAGEWRYDTSAAVQSDAAETDTTSSGKQTITVASASKKDVGPVPANNMTMEAVRAQFGPPSNEADPVGEPPINRWYYHDYTVYFEYDRVVISVIN